MTILPWMRIAAAGLVAAVLFGAGWTANGWRLGAKIDKREAEIAQQATDRANALAKAEADARSEEARRDAAKKEIDHVAALARTRADDEHRAVVAGQRRLLDAFRTAGSRQSPPDPGAVGVGQAAEEPADSRAYVFGLALEAAGELAKALDHARAAGLACERSYDSLTPSTGADP